MAQALYRKWRPRLWDEVVAQEHVVRTLRNAIAGDRVAHAYLFAGPRGTGKTTTARLLAKAVNCLADDKTQRPCDQCPHCAAVNEGRFMDLIEIDAASNTSVEDVRDLRDKINFSPSQGTFKVYIIDEVHMLSTAAFNALLKTLEEPPPHAIFILATTEVHKIPATVLSRCQRHEFRRIPVSDISRHLQDLARQEGLEVDPEAIQLIARQATGAMRDAISLLDQLSSTGKTIDLAMAQQVLGTATHQTVIELVDALLKQEAARGLNEIHRALDAGTDPRQFARQVVEYLRGLLMIRMGNADQVEATAEQRVRMAQQANEFDGPHLLQTIRAFNQAATDLRGGWHPGLLLELAFGESLRWTAPATAPVVAVPAAQPVYASSPEPAPARPTYQPAPPQSAPRTPPAEPPTRQQPGTAQPAAARPTGSRPEAAQPTPEPPAAPPPPQGTFNFQSLTQAWGKIRQVVKKASPQTEGLLNSCRLIGIKDGNLLIGFGSEVLKNKMEAGTNQEITTRSIAQVTGVTLGIRCMVHTGKAGSLPPDVEVDTDGMVGTALRDLGGEVVDVQ